MTQPALKRLALLAFVTAILVGPALLPAQDDTTTPTDDTGGPTFRPSNTTIQPDETPEAQPTTQEKEATSEDEEDVPPRKWYEGLSTMVLLGGGVILLFVFMGRGRRKQDRHRREMISNIKKGDKVTTIGGIVGTVVDIREDEITVKVDESSNARMRFARWAVRNIGDEKQDQEKK